MEIENSLQEAGQYITLASVLGGFAFAAVVELLVSDKKGKLATAVIAMFSTAALMFLYSLLSYVLVYSALLVENPALDTLTRVGATALVVIFIAIFLLLASIGASGWLHSRSVGIATSIAAVIFMCSTLIMIFTVIMAVPSAS
jgi:hypothetical protein